MTLNGANVITPNSPDLHQRWAELQTELAALKQKKRVLRQKDRRVKSSYSGKQQRLALACILERTPLAEHQAVAETFRRQQKNCGIQECSHLRSKGTYAEPGAGPSTTVQELLVKDTSQDVQAQF